MSKSTLKIRFFLRRNHVYADGTCCIMTRITINWIFSTNCPPMDYLN